MVQLSLHHLKTHNHDVEFLEKMELET